MPARRFGFRSSAKSCALVSAKVLIGADDQPTLPVDKREENERAGKVFASELLDTPEQLAPEYP